MRELGRVIRTGFLLQYLSDPELRRLILRAMNKSELFNGFRRCLVIFHNVVTMTKVIRQLIAEGYPVNAEALAVLSPYQTAHINRLGRYTLQLDREPEPIEYDLPFSVFQRPVPQVLSAL